MQDSNFKAVAPKNNTLAPEKLNLVISYGDAFGVRDVEVIRRALASLIASNEGGDIHDKVVKLLELSDMELDKKYKEVVTESIELAKNPIEVEYYKHCSDDKLVIVYTKRSKKKNVEDQILSTTIPLKGMTYEERIAMVSEWKKGSGKLEADLLKQVIELKKKS